MNVQKEAIATLGVDFGTKFIGLATFSPGRDPFPLPYGRLANDSKLWLNLARIIQEEDIQQAVIGVPYLLDGKETNMSRQAKNFAQQFQSKFEQIKVHQQDETLTSFEAEERMKKSPRYGFKIVKEEIDALSASIMLEEFFNQPF
jgi:putative Holliday junction resolvase